MGIESVLVMSGVMETLTRRFQYFSRGKGCFFCVGSSFVLITGSEEGGFERTGSSSVLAEEQAFPWLVEVSCSR